MKITNVHYSKGIVYVDLTQLEPYRLEAVAFEEPLFHDFARAFDYDFTNNEFDSDGETIWPTN